MDNIKINELLNVLERSAEELEYWDGFDVKLSGRERARGVMDAVNFIRRHMEDD